MTHTSNIFFVLDTNRLYPIISSPKFLNMEALGGEIPFFIADYDPQQEPKVEKDIAALMRKLNTNGIKCLLIDLYDLTIELLQQELGEEAIFEIEQEMTDKEEFKDALQSVLDVDSVLLPAIKTRIAESQAAIYLVQGIGKVYPYIRSHIILNNLQNVAVKAPTIIFYPGKYSGRSLQLFGRLKDDNYYRAFNLNEFKW